MNTVPWDPEKHRATLERWIQERKMAPDAGPADLYPPTGAVAETAICFIYFTDAPGRAYLDDLFTDPSATHDARRKGVYAVLRALLEEADRRGVRTVLAATRHTMLIEEGTQLGFQAFDSGLTWFARARK